MRKTSTIELEFHDCLTEAGTVALASAPDDLSGLRISVFPDECLQDGQGDFALTGRHQVQISGTQKSLGDLGRYLAIAIAEQGVSHHSIFRQALEHHLVGRIFRFGDLFWLATQRTPPVWQRGDKTSTIELEFHDCLTEAGTVALASAPDDLSGLRISVFPRRFKSLARRNLLAIAISYCHCRTGRSSARLRVALRPDSGWREF